MDDIVFNQAYNNVFNSVVKEGVPQKNHCVIFLGGQPGSGKSHFCYQDNGFNNYIVIDRDNKLLYPNDRGISAVNTLKNVLNIDKWNRRFEITANDFIDEKVIVLEKQKKKSRR